MYFPVSAWFTAFVLTVVIEGPVVWLFVRRQEPDLLRLGPLVVFANLATHPAVWFIFTQLLLVGTRSYTLVTETWAVGAEALFYLISVRGLSARRALAASLAANAASYLVGVLIGGLSPGSF
jgi:hypothetical protein